MKRKQNNHQTGNEQGNILIVCVVIIMILTSLGIYALNSTNMELTMAASDRRETIVFQNAEAGLKFAIAHFKLIYNNDDNSGNPLYRADANGTGIGGNISTPGGVVTITNVPSGTLLALRDMPLGLGGVIFTYNDANNNPVAQIEIRDVARAPLNIAVLSTYANSVPAFPHLSDPPTGYDSSLYDGRNYVITSTGMDDAGNLSGTTVQCGVKAAALKESVAHLRGL